MLPQHRRQATSSSSPHEDPATGAVPGEFNAHAVPSTRTVEQMIADSGDDDLKETLRRRKAESTHATR